MLTAERENDRRHGRRERLHWITAAVALGAAAAAGAQERKEFRELHMGMEVRIVMYAPSDTTAREAARAAFDRIAALEQIMSDYRPESEVRRLERHTRRPIGVSGELFDVLRTARDVAERSDGAFDPTVAPLVRLWREARRTGVLPARRELDSARALVDWRLLLLEASTQSVTLQRPGMRLDLGGVAKGYILGRALERLRARGIAMALVEAGGDIVAGDAPPGERGWSVDAPFGDANVRTRAAGLANAAVATSGPSGQFVESGGVRYSHVIDPRTGRALTSGAHATVIATDGAIADALATALTVAAPRDRERLMDAYRGTVIAWSVTP